MRSEGTVAHHSATFLFAPENRNSLASGGQAAGMGSWYGFFPMPLSRFLPILPLAAVFALSACQSTPDKPAPASASPDGGAKSRAEKADEPEAKHGFFSDGAIKWPWQKDKSASPDEKAADKPKISDKKAATAPEKAAEPEPKSGWHWPWQKKDKAAPAEKESSKVESEEPLPASNQNPGPVADEAAKPKKKGWFAGWHWPWQKKQADDEAENPEPAPPPVDALPTRPVPLPEAIQPRVPEPGLAPSNTPPPRGNNNTKERDPLSGVGLHPGS